MPRIAKTNFQRYVADADKAITYVVASHLWIEHLLIECLRVSLRRPSALFDKQSLSFPLLVALCESLEIVETDFAEVLRKLNGLRNKFAHRLRYEPDLKEVAALQNALAEMKEPILVSRVPPSKHEILLAIAAISGFLERRAATLGVRGVGVA